MADLAAFAENIWIVDGPIVRDMDVIFTARMAVVKLSDGSLWVNSFIHRIEQKNMIRITSITALQSGLRR
jgi:hypothetical protein